MTRRLAMVAACCAALTSAPGCSSRPRPPRWEGPTVDMACVDHARRGDLLASLPHEVGGFQVSTTPIGVALRRDGRALDDALARKIFAASIEQHTGDYPMDTGDPVCAGLGPGSCYGMSTYVCQVSLETIAGWVNQAATELGAADGALGINIIVNDSAPPTCPPAGCTPRLHYSSKGHYDPSAARNPSPDDGFGQCLGDGECQPDEGYCSAWYMGGQTQTLEYVQMPPRTFCGCINQRCSWFTQ